MLGHGGGVQQAGGDEFQFGLHAAMGKILAQLLLQTRIAPHLGRADKHRALGGEYLGAQHIFQRALIIQLNQGFHAANLRPYCYYTMQNAKKSSAAHENRTETLREKFAGRFFEGLWLIPVLKAYD